MSEIVGLDSVLAIMGKICKTTQQRRLRIKLARSVKAKLHVAQFASELVSDLSTGVKLYVKAKQQSAPGRKEDVYLTEGYGAINSDSGSAQAVPGAAATRQQPIVLGGTSADSRCLGCGGPTDGGNMCETPCDANAAISRMISD